MNLEKFEQIGWIVILVLIVITGLIFLVAFIKGNIFLN